MSATSNNSTSRPRVWLVGEHEHPDFGDVVALLRDEAEVVLDGAAAASAELIVVARSRPSVTSFGTVEQLRRVAPLAGVAALLGSWCEGQARASRPSYDALRLYWYEFAPWWRRQMSLRNARLCPDWARPDAVGSRTNLLLTPSAVPNTESLMPDVPVVRSRGVVALSTAHWDTAEALSEMLRRVGFATIWHPPGRPVPCARGVEAGLWDGGQLDDRELAALSDFCRRLARDSARVVALFDFPRRDRCEVARRAGASAVLGKPWHNAELVATLSSVVIGRQASHAA